jgi:hypothetical protein
MKMPKKFYQKTGVAIEKIASELFLLKKGERISNVTEFQEKYGFARGTVQNALNYLKEEEAIETISKGHLGTYLTEIDYPKLRLFADVDQLKGTMPLPYSKLYEGLATGLYLLFQEQNIKLSMAYIRGSEERVRAVELGHYDFAGTSRFAAEKMIEEDRKIKIIKSFGDYSYLSRHVLLFSEDSFTEIEDGMRVGIDSDSLDHVTLTKEIVKDKDVEFVEIPSNQLIFGLREGQIDAGIWNYDEIVDKQISDLTFVEIKAEDYRKSMSEAVLVCHQEDKITQTLCQNYIEVQQVKKIQEKIKTGEMTPRY